jgi:hypothetical protein
MRAARPRPEATDEARRAAYTALTEEMEQSLKNATYATENWEIHQLLHRARTLVRAERAARAGARLPRPTMAERVLAFRRLWMGYNELKVTRPEEVRRFLARIRRYDAELAALALDDHELDSASTTSRWLGSVALALRALIAYLVLPPVLVFGYLVNLPPALVTFGITRWRSGSEKDEATIKMLAGAAAFPLAWLVASLLIVLSFRRLEPLADASTSDLWLLGVLAFCLSALGGLVTVHYQRFALQTFRAFRLRATQSGQASSLARLRAERSELSDDMVRLARGLDLPGKVLPDGRILDETFF